MASTGAAFESFKICSLVISRVTFYGLNESIVTVSPRAGLSNGCLQIKEDFKEVSLKHNNGIIKKHRPERQ